MQKNPLHTKLCDSLGIEYPIIAFTHCKDVVAAVTNAGGFAVMGETHHTPEEIEAHAFGIISQGPALLSLGGDHFVSYPLLRAHHRKHGEALSLLHFDAHSDTWADANDRIDHGKPGLYD